MLIININACLFHILVVVCDLLGVGNEQLEYVYILVYIHDLLDNENVSFRKLRKERKKDESVSVMRKMCVVQICRAMTSSEVSCGRISCCGAHDFETRVRRDGFVYHW